MDFKQWLRGFLEKKLKLSQTLEQYEYDSSFIHHNKLCDLNFGFMERMSCPMQCDSDLLDRLKQAFALCPAIKSEPLSIGPIFCMQNLGYSLYEGLNNTYSFKETKTLLPLIEEFLSQKSDEIRQMTKSPFLAVNVRAWETKPNCRNVGPTEWHTDGFPDGHLKIMLYLDELGDGHGSIEIDGEGCVTAPAGLALLFRNSDVMHRAIRASNDSMRPVIEITLMRTLRFSSTNGVVVGLNSDRHLASPFFAYEDLSLIKYLDGRIGQFSTSVM